MSAIYKRDTGVEVAKLRNPGPLIALYVARRNDAGQSILPDLSHRIAGDLTTTLMVAADRGGSPSGRAVLQTNGVNKYLELPDNLFDGMTKGSLVMALRADSGATARLLGDGTPSAAALRVTVPITAILSFRTDVGGGDPETLSLNTGFLFDEFTTLGFEWGPTGKRIFVRGAMLAEDTALTGAAGTSLNAPRIGRESSTYSSLAFRGLAVFDDNIGARSHRVMHEYFWREPI